MNEQVVNEVLKCLSNVAKTFDLNEYRIKTLNFGQMAKIDYGSEKISVFKDSAVPNVLRVFVSYPMIINDMTQPKGLTCEIFIRMCTLKKAERKPEICGASPLGFVTWTKAANGQYASIELMGSHIDLDKYNTVTGNEATQLLTEFLTKYNTNEGTKHINLVYLNSRADDGYPMDRSLLEDEITPKVDYSAEDKITFRRDDNAEYTFIDYTNVCDLAYYHTDNPLSRLAKDYCHCIGDAYADNDYTYLLEGEIVPSIYGIDHMPSAVEGNYIFRFRYLELFKIFTNHAPDYCKCSPYCEVICPSDKVDTTWRIIDKYIFRQHGELICKEAENGSERLNKTLLDLIAGKISGNK